MAKLPPKQALNQDLDPSKIFGLAKEAPKYPLFGNSGLTTQDLIQVAAGTYGTLNALLPYGRQSSRWRIDDTSLRFREGGTPEGTNGQTFGYMENAKTTSYPWLKIEAMPMRLLNVLEEEGNSANKTVFFDAPITEEVARFESQRFFRFRRQNYPHFWDFHLTHLQRMGDSKDEIDSDKFLNAMDWYLVANPRYNGLCPVGWFNDCFPSATRCPGGNSCFGPPKEAMGGSLWASGKNCQTPSFFRDYNLDGRATWSNEQCHPLVPNPMFVGQNRQQWNQFYSNRPDAIRRRATSSSYPVRMMGVRPDEFHPVGSTIWKSGDEPVYQIPSTMIDQQYTRKIEKWRKFVIKVKGKGYDDTETLVVYRADPQVFTDTEGNRWVSLGDVVERFTSDDKEYPDEPGWVPGWNWKDATGITHKGDHIVYPKQLVRAVYVNADLLSKVDGNSRFVGDGQGGPTGRIRDAAGNWWDVYRNAQTNTGFIVGAGQIPNVEWYVPITPEERLACCRRKGASTLTCGENVPQSQQCDELVSRMCKAVAVSPVELEKRDREAGVSDEERAKRKDQYFALYKKWMGQEENFFCSCWQPATDITIGGVPADQIDEGNELFETIKTCTGNCAATGYKTKNMMDRKCPALCANVANILAGRDIKFSGGANINQTNNCKWKMNAKKVTREKLSTTQVEKAFTPSGELAKPPEAGAPRKNTPLAPGAIAGIVVALVLLLGAGITVGVLGYQGKLKTKRTT